MADYFGLNRYLSILLVLIPFTCWLFGVVTRCQEKKIVAALIRCFLGGWILWLCDVINTIMNGCNVKIVRFIDC